MPERAPIQDPDHLLPPPKQKMGPIVGTLIILIVLLVGVVYLLERKISERNSINTIPYIPSGTTTLPTITSSSSAPR